MPTPPEIPRRYLACRRWVECLAVALALPLLVVLGALTALAVCLESPGPALFAQMRPGRGGRMFRMYKFRSMYVETSQRPFRLTDPGADPRVTRVGRVIRQWRLDELPQLWNVVRGDMSLIGPRPVPADLYARYRLEIPQYDLRHLVRPGLTGWAQVRQGYTHTVEDEAAKWQLDLYYIHHLSVRLDLRIVGETLWTIATGFGAR
jgi:lipopolysaccharide/colanic/teichoic acid biosynthesis glycosyltransferase